MTDLTVITPSPGLDRWGEYAALHMRQAIMEALRALSGGDRIYEFKDNMLAHFEEAQESKSGLILIYDEAFNEPIRTLGDTGYKTDLVAAYHANINSIVCAALKVAAETIASDSAAAGRRSKRVDALIAAIRWAAEVHPHVYRPK
jgi:hypothetical protein